VDEEIVAFRIVDGREPLATDFRSHYEAGKRPNLTRRYDAFAWFGVSMFLNRERVDRFAARSRSEGRPAWTATIRLRPESGLHVVYNDQTTHLEVFGFPHVLLEMVDHVDE
jgi:hypothetical protein